ncbi:MAG: CRTAC1 family protein [Bryobacteraceae bacterium]|nr:CRTAC1 family protein [Bryobacteraceae bacterium]
MRIGLAAMLVIAATACSRRPDPESTPAPLFREAAEEAGLVFRHQNGASGAFHLPEIMGSGVALIDYDGDGDLDVYFVQGDTRAKGNRLYRNLLIPSGKLRFEDRTAEARAGHAGAGMGVATGDYDGDGDPDLLVTNLGPIVLYRNDGGSFTDVTSAARLASEGWHTSASFVDYDRDGDLDLFVARYVDFGPGNARSCKGATGELDYCTPKAYRPVVDRLFRNDGTGHFTDVTGSAGIGSATGPGLGVVAADFNRDGWPEIYVANDGEANHLWVNQRDGTFREAALESGVAFGEDGLPQAGMGLAVADYDHNGAEDILVTNLTREGATLYRNEGDGFFTDVSALTAVRRLTYDHTGFGAAWIDVDSDERLDLMIVNGAVTVMESQRGHPQPFRQPSLLLMNRGAAFESVQLPAAEAVSRGAAVGDIDNDGDLDVVISNNGGPARLLLNQAAPGANWLRVRLEGRQPVGALVSLEGRTKQTKRLRTDGSYLSANEGYVHFTLATETPPARIVVTWPLGRKEVWPSPQPRTVLTLKEGTGQAIR